MSYTCFQILSQSTAAGLNRAGQLDQLLPAERCCEWDGRQVALFACVRQLCRTNCWYRRAAIGTWESCLGTNRWSNNSRTVHVRTAAVVALLRGSIGLQ